MNLFQAHSKTAKFDYFTSSIRFMDKDWRDFLAPVIHQTWPDITPKEATPNKPFLKGVEVLNDNQNRLLLISYGGDHVKGITQVHSTGDNAPDLHRALKLSGLDHEPTRIDSAIDWDEEYLFDTLAPVFKQFAVEKGLKIGMLGDWHRNEARTLSIGSRNAPLFVRLYEKGYEQRAKGDEKASLSWVRFEVEIKYKKSKQRRRMAQLSPSDMFSLGWIGDLCKTIMFEVSSMPMPSSYSSPDIDRSLAHVKKQYRKVFERLADQCESPEEFMNILLSRNVA